jgi:hypothetical protein
MEKMAARASADDFFLGIMLVEFKASRHIDDTELSRFLGCEMDALAILALCRRPNMEGERFQDDLQRIADFTKCNADQLVQLVREATCLQTLRKRGDAGDTSFLAAARDAVPKDTDGQTEE